MKAMTRPVNQRVLAIVDQALAERFTVRPCATCGERKTADRLSDVIDADRALRQVARLAFSHVGELFDQHGNLRPIHELPDHVAGTIASIKIVKRQTQVIQTVRFGDKLKALEMLLTYLGLLTIGNIRALSALS